MRIAGAVVFVLGVALAARSVLLLSGRGRPQRGPRPALIIAGPYTKIRNPLFAGIVLAMLGVAVARRSWVLVAIATTVWLVAHVWLIALEEPRLRRRFGPAYDAYLENVPRWLPRQRTRNRS